MNAKKLINDWLRENQHLEISVAELQKYKTIKTFTRSYLRELKNPIVKSTTGNYSKP